MKRTVFYLFIYFADKECQYSRILLDQLERDCICYWSGNRILSGGVTPYISSVNWLKYFFSQQNKSFFLPKANRIFVLPLFQVLPDKRTLKLLKSQNINVNWYMYCPETAVLLLSTTVQGNVLQPFAFKVSLMSYWLMLMKSMQEFWICRLPTTRGQQ